MTNLNTIKIIQHNVLAWTAPRKFELYNVYRNINPDVILINAHGVKDEQRIKLFDYNVYQRNTQNELHAGVAIAVKRSIRHEIIDDLEEDYLAIKVTTSTGPLLIATGYQPPRRPNLPNNTLLRIFRDQNPVLFAGDLNARHRILDHGNNNPAGEFINQLIRRGNTLHIGPYFKTYITPRASGTPDIVLTNNKMNHNMHLCPGPLTSSDHLPIIITLAASPIQVPVTPRPDYNNANWENFVANLETYNIPDLNNQPTRQIDDALHNWFGKVKTAMKDNIPQVKYRTLPHPRITNELKLLRNSFNNIQRRAENTGWTPQLRNTVKIIQNNMSEILKQQRNEIWNELLNKTEALYREPDKFWKQIRNLMGSETSANIPYLLNPNGEKLTTDAEQAEEFRRHLRNTFNISREENDQFCQETQLEVETFLENSEDHLPYNIIDYNRLNEENPLTRQISRNEILATIRSFKNKKAPGQTKIDKTILMKLPIIMIDALREIFNAALSTGYFPKAFKIAIIKMLLKKGKQSIHPVNFRPISLLETVGKTYEKILNSRLKRFLASNNHNNPNQHAYQSNRGTASAIAITYQRIATTQQDRYQCNLVNRDISKAFDKVWHAGLKYKICRLNMPRIFTATLCNFLDNRSAIVQMNNHKTAPFPLNAGVPQGAVLSPTLFNIFTADLKDLYQSQLTAYADDVTQVISHHGASKQFLQRKTIRAIKEVNEFEQKWKIKTNNNKFQILHISKRNPLPINIDQTQLNYVRETTILGMKLKSTGFSGHVKQQRLKASINLRKLRRFKNLNPRLKLHLYKALILPIIDYPPIPYNTIKPTNWKSLQALQNKALRWINGDAPPYNTTVEQLHEIYNLKPLNIRNFRLAYNAWEKIRAEFPEETEVYETTEYARTHAWWPLAYIPANAVEPRPIYKKETRLRPNNNNNEDEDE